MEVRSSTTWDWESGDPTWLTATTEDVSQSGDQAFTFEVSENTTGVTRESTLTFTTEDNAYSLTLTVRQGPDPKPFWVQLGADIDGDGASSLGFGRSVVMNADGNRVVIDGRKMYGLSSSNTWEQIGPDLTTRPGGGVILSLSTDGNTVAMRIGRTLYFYIWNGASWDEINADLFGDVLHGSKISVSADTFTVAVGDPGNDDNGEDSGQVQVYRWNGGSLIWQQLGSNFNGEDLFDRTGSHVSLSADGNSLAIATPGIDNNGAGSGRVRFYNWNGSSWNPFCC